MSNELVTTNQNQPLEFSAFGSEGNFISAQRMAKALSSSSIVPTTYQGEQNLGNCIIALEISNRIGSSVLAVMQQLYIVHGKPGWSSQFLIACLNASNRFSPLRYKSTGEKGKDTWGCIAWATDKTGEVLESPEVTIAMAKAEGWYGKNGSKWQTLPELMLRYRAATFFTRLYAPELTMGIQTSEELGDILDVDATVTSTPAAPSFKKKEKATAPAIVEVPPVPPVPPVEPPATEPEPAPAPAPRPTRPKPAAKPEPAQPPVTPEPAPTTEATGHSAAILDLRAAMQECDVTAEQVIRFVASKNALKEGTDADLATLFDIIESKVPAVAKMIRQKGGAYKEMIA